MERLKDLKKAIMSAASGNDSLPPKVEPASETNLALSNPVSEQLYEQTCAALAAQPAPSQQTSNTVIVLVSMVLFAGAALSQTGFSLLALTWWLLPLIGVLLLHEAGHYVGMRLFGYRDLRMFFIPFFGAAVTGEKHAAPAWQQAIVLLLGPLPGIVLGVLLCAFPPPWLTIPVALLLLVINGFNLLPLFPLDGGRLLHVLFLSRRPLWEGALLVSSCVGLAVLGWLAGSWLLAVLAIALFVGIPSRYRVRQQIAALRQELPTLPTQLGGLSEAQRLALFQRTRLLKPNSGDPSECANEMKALHEAAVTKPAAVIPSFALLAFYAAGAIIVLWSLSYFFHWGEGEQPGEWSQRRIETLLKGELKLNQISLEDVGPGRYAGTGETADGTKWNLKVVQDNANKRLTWNAANEDGKRKVGRLRMSSGVLIDETIR